MSYVKLALGIVALLAVTTVGLGWLFLPKIELVNQSSLGEFELSWTKTQAFLLQSGYWRHVDSITIVYTDQPQEVFELAHQGETVLTFGAQRENDRRDLTLFIHYAPDKFDLISQSPSWLSADIMAVICLGVEGRNIGGHGCYRQIDQYLGGSGLQNLGKVIRKTSASFWLSVKQAIVKPAYAQICVGTIVCGQEHVECRCEYDSNVPCQVNYQCREEDLGDCICSEPQCLEGSNNVSCGVWTTGDSCAAATIQNSCDNWCNPISDPGWCTWYGGTGCPPGEIFCGGCINACMGNPIRLFVAPFVLTPMTTTNWRK